MTKIETLTIVFACFFVMSEAATSQGVAQSENEIGSTVVVPGENSRKSDARDQEPFANSLTDNANQIWRTYDISGYTSAVKSVPHPEKNILDWILRETGTDVWFGQPTAVLSVGRQSIKCYHTPAIPAKVSEIVERFLRTRNQDEVFGLQLLTLGNPNWRAKALPLLTRFETKTQGVEGWLTTKENAAQLFTELRKRSDFGQTLSPTLVTESGQPKKIKLTQPIDYFRSILIDSSQFPPFRVETARVEEGLVVQFSSLRSGNGKMMDAEIFCNLKQVEQFRRVNIDIPTVNGTPQQHPISVPQLSSWRLKERFLWPVDRVLSLSMGVVASPDRKSTSVNIQSVFDGKSRRAEVLFFVDCKGIYQRGKTPSSAFRLVPVPNRR